LASRRGAGALGGGRNGRLTFEGGASPDIASASPWVLFGKAIRSIVRRTTTLGKRDIVAARRPIEAVAAAPIRPSIEPLRER